MCVVSYVSEHYRCPHVPTWDGPNYTSYPTTYYPVYPTSIPPPAWEWEKAFKPPEPKKTVEWTPEAWKLFREILAKVAELDKQLGQPDCEDSEKQKWMKEVEDRLKEKI